MDPQRLVKFCFIAWFLFGLAGFFLYGGYSAVDSVYLMAQILTTVGYGDPAAMMPTTGFGYLFMTCYVLMSVMMLAGFAGTAVDGFLEGQDHRIKGVVDRMAEGTAYREFGKRHPGLRKFLRAFLIWAVIVAVGVAFFTCWEGEGDPLPDRSGIRQYTALEALYMSVITLTTVGFGDKTPRTEVGKLFAAAWMLVGSAALANMAAKFAAVFLQAQRKYGLSMLEQQTLERILLDTHVQASQRNRMQLVQLVAEKRIDLKTTTVAKADFMLFMLKDLGIVQPWLLDELEKNFDELDWDKSGYIDEKDLAAGAPPAGGSYSAPAAPA